MSNWTSVVVGIDFTPCAASALRQAIRIAERSQAGLHVVHVIETLAVTDLEEALGPFQADIRAGLIRDAGKTWKEFTADVPAASTLELAVEINNPVVALLRHVRQQSADLLVLGTHGRTNLRDLLLGSTAERVVRDAPCSILAVKPEGFEHPLGRG